jgi:hypothetical protein
MYVETEDGWVLVEVRNCGCGKPTRIEYVSHYAWLYCTGCDFTIYMEEVH